MTVMNELSGKSLIAGVPSEHSGPPFRATSPATGTELLMQFSNAVRQDIDRALEAAGRAVRDPLWRDSKRRAQFLEELSSELEADRSALVDLAELETGLPADRLNGELTRTIRQLQMFAGAVVEGCYVDARIDHAVQGEAAVPDVRSMNAPLGPVAVFGASNFPFAFSVAGGDTASAVAVGCPVIVKAHPSHPGTSERTAEAVLRSLRNSALPLGAFSLLQGNDNSVGRALVMHSMTRVVTFTGSLAGGMALYEAVQKRADPIPMFAEMGSTNPVFVLPEALECRAEEIAKSYVDSVSLGTGQFCTKPGILVALEGGGLDRFLTEVRSQAETVTLGPMLNKRISSSYQEAISTLGSSVVALEPNAALSIDTGTAGEPRSPRFFAVPARTLLSEPRLQDEMFGPASIVVLCQDAHEMGQVANSVSGQLTASIHAEPTELSAFHEVVAALESRVGRLVMNGFPTGVRVSDAMHHGGPFPATTDARFTSVGTRAMLRFCRPVCYQDWPDDALPDALKDANPLGLLRKIDGVIDRF